MNVRRVAVAVAVVGVVSSHTAHAQATEAPPPAKPFSLFGDWMERQAGVRAFGFLQVGGSRNDTSTRAGCRRRLELPGHRSTESSTATGNLERSTS